MSNEHVAQPFRDILRQVALPQIEHALKFVSADGQRAVCTCGQWEHLSGVKHSKTEIQREFLSHVYPSAQIYEI